MSTLGNSSSPSGNGGAEEQSGPRVLLVKDHNVTNRTYTRALRGKGFQLTAIDHGPEALRAMMEQQYDLIIIEVPCWGQTEDFTAVVVLRKYLWLMDVPCMIFSKRVDQWQPERCNDLQVAAVFHPYRPPLQEVVRCACELTNFKPAHGYLYRDRKYTHPSGAPPDNNSNQAAA